MNENKKPKIEHGTKFDVGKPRFELIAPDAELWLAKVLTHGADKYADNNWTGLTVKRVLGSLKRHLNAVERGEDIDDQGDNPSHMPHHALLLTNAMFLTHLLGNYPAQDDRPFKKISAPSTPRHGYLRTSNEQNDVYEQKLAPRLMRQEDIKSIDDYWDWVGQQQAAVAAANAKKKPTKKKAR